MVNKTDMYMQAVLQEPGMGVDAAAHTPSWHCLFCILYSSTVIAHTIQSWCLRGAAACEQELRR
jgi:hypothetical protein